MTLLKTTAAGIYVELDPSDGAGATALMAYVEVGIGEGSGVASTEVTALQALVELEPGWGVRATSLIAYVEVDKPWSDILVPPMKPPEPEIYDQEGRRLTYIDGSFARRVFLLNDAGSGELAVSRKNPIVTQHWLVPDHLVLVRSRFGLPDWIGVITEVEYSAEQIVTARLLESIVLLSRWNGFGFPLGQTGMSGETEQSETATAKALITGAVSRVNARYESLIRVKELELSSIDFIEIQHAVDKSILDEFHEIGERFPFDFWIEPFFDVNNRLFLGLHVLDERTRDRRPQVQLWEGKHLGDNCRYKEFSLNYKAEYNETLEIEITDTSIWPYLQLGDVFGIHAASLGPEGIERDVRAMGFEPDEESGDLIVVGYLL